ncbi:MAG: exonuclease domain-containing protein [Gemmataceae bacterium]
MDTFAAIDFETADDGRDSACAVAVVRVEGARIVRRESTLIRPPRALDGGAMKWTHIHGLRFEDVKDAPPFAEAWAKVLPAVEGCARLVAHNAPFDRSVLAACLAAAKLPPVSLPWTCTLALATQQWPKPARNRLPDVCERLGISFTNHHDAAADAEGCARILMAMEGRKEEASVPAEAPPREPGAEFEAVMRIAREAAAGVDGVDDAKRIIAAAAELCTDAAGGAVATADLERWVREWAAQKAEARAKWGFTTREHA